MGFDFSGLNNAVIDTFADDGVVWPEIIIETRTGDHSRKGIYDADYLADQLDYTTINKPDYMISMHTIDFESTDAAKGDYITIRGIKLQIIDFEKDVAGMVVIQLRNDATLVS